jgi:hypothetical protein
MVMFEHLDPAHPPSPRRAALAVLVLFILGLALMSTRAEGSASPDTNGPTLVVVVGAAGEKEYGDLFREWAAQWEKHGKSAHAHVLTVGLETNSTPTDKERLQTILKDEPKEGAAVLWLVLLGHGTFHRETAKFNLRGPDLSPEDLALWLKPFHRPLAIINTASASAPFLHGLSAPGRVIITATRSGSEQNFARFGRYLSSAIADPRADLDKDGQTSLLEAYLLASREVAEFYESEGRLATEHPLLDDNGDGLGTPADWFRGIRAVKKAKEGAEPDGLRAHQMHLIRSQAEQQMPPALRAKRNELELAIARLRESKGQLTEDAYYHQLEPLLLELAKLYEQVDATKPAPPDLKPMKSESDFE